LRSHALVLFQSPQLAPGEHGQVQYPEHGSWPVKLLLAWYEHRNSSGKRKWCFQNWVEGWQISDLDTWLQS
jgi:hypothetical protein